MSGCSRADATEIGVTALGAKQTQALVSQQVPSTLRALNLQSTLALFGAEVALPDRLAVGWGIAGRVPV